MSLQLTHHTHQKIQKRPLAEVREEQLNVAKPRKKSKTMDVGIRCAITALADSGVYYSDIAKQLKVPAASISAVVRHAKKRKQEKESVDPKTTAKMPLSSVCLTVLSPQLSCVFADSTS